MNIPPLISRTPPPLPDDDDDDDDDDEFGHYVIGEVIENGVTTTYDEIIEDAKSTGEFNNHSVGSKSANDDEISTIGLDFQPDPDQTELQQPSLSTKPEQSSTDLDIDEHCSLTVLDCDSRELEVTRTAIDRECSQLNSVVDDEHQDDCTPPSETTVNGDRQGDDSNQIDGFSTYERPVTLSQDEFVFEESNLVTNGKTSSDSFNNHGEVASNTPIDNVQPDLANHTTQSEIGAVTSPYSPTSFHDFDNGADKDAVELENDDDFDDFADFQTSVPDNWKNDEPKTELDNFQGFPDTVHEQAEETVPSDHCKSCLIDEINTNAIWGCLQYLDDTPALKYQWLSSSSNHKLLSALKIDSRNIFCGPWTRSSKSLKLEVSQPPKAINFVDHPNSSHHHPSSNLPGSRGSSPNLSFPSDSHDKSSVPDPLFDWEGSGLVNPLFYSAKEDRSLDCDTRRGVVENLISAEAQEVLKSLPDLSYMTKTYIAFNSISTAK